MAQIGFTRDQFNREMYSMASLGINRLDEWCERFGYGRNYLRLASKRLTGKSTKDIFKKYQLEVARDMVLHSNLNSAAIAIKLGRSDQWLSREYQVQFGESITATRQNRLWSGFKG